MALFCDDQFTDTAGTSLSSHTPTGRGGTWTRHASAGASASLVISDANRCRLGGTNTGLVLFYLSDAPAGNEYDVECSLYFATASQLLGPAGRVATGANSAYFARCNSSAGTWELHKVVSGTVTLLGSWAPGTPPSAGETHSVRLEIRSGAKKLHVDGVERISSTDDTHTSTGRAGLRDFSNAAGSNTTGVHVDDFRAADLSRLRPAGLAGGVHDLEGGHRG